MIIRSCGKVLRQSSAMSPICYSSPRGAARRRESLGFSITSDSLAEWEALSPPRRDAQSHFSISQQSVLNVPLVGFPTHTNLLGAGSAGIGLADLLCSAMVEEGLRLEQAQSQVYMFTSTASLKQLAPTLLTFKSRTLTNMHRLATLWPRSKVSNQQQSSV